MVGQNDPNRYWCERLLKKRFSNTKWVFLFLLSICYKCGSEGWGHSGRRRGKTQLRGFCWHWKVVSLEHRLPLVPRPQEKMQGCCSHRLLVFDFVFKCSPRIVLTSAARKFEVSEVVRKSLSFSPPRRGNLRWVNALPTCSDKLL